MNSGIYSLTFNGRDEEVYIGKSVDIRTRFRDHCSKLISGTHKNYKLLSSYHKYGLPILSLIEAMASDNESAMYLAETYWIREFDSYNNGYNLTEGGDSGPVFKGASHPNSKVSEEQLLQAFNLLCDNILTQKEISSVCKVSKGIVERIAQGTGHRWLQERYPEKHSQLMLINRDYRKKISKNTAKDMRVTYPDILSPECIVYSNIENLSSFCKANNLQSSNLYKLFNGERHSHKGWTLA